MAEEIDAAEQTGDDEGGSTTGGFVAGIVVGAMLGAGLALLLAPERGERTRKRMGDELRRLRRRAGEGLDAASARGRRDLLRRRKRARARLRDVLDDLL